MRHFTLVRSLFLLLALAGVACNDEDTDPASFSGTLNASSGVPPTTSTATGSVALDFDGDSTIRFRVDVANLSNPTTAHIHSGATGATGPVRVTLFSGGGTTTTPMNGELVEGSFTSSDVQGIAFDALLEELRAGTAYADVHTTQFPDGEIRGQIRLRQ
jgi:hypothetical protein